MAWLTHPTSALLYHFDPCVVPVAPETKHKDTRIERNKQDKQKRTARKKERKKNNKLKLERKTNKDSLQSRTSHKWYLKGGGINPQVLRICHCKWSLGIKVCRPTNAREIEPRNTKYEINFF